MRTYAIVGASGRGIGMFAVPIAAEFGDVAKLVGVFDPNHKRASLLQRKCGGGFPVYSGFTEMIEQARPDVVIVATVDRYHHEYMIQAMEMGCDVITEKPMTIDEDKCNAILAAERRTGRTAVVTFNMRYMPFCRRVKELVREGAAGEILSVHFEWFLDTGHGADYFRRWHRNKENSGGLLITKSTHHFDFVNWLLEEDPVQVSAFGSLRFYGPTRQERGVRCLTCDYKKTCEFYLDIREGELRELFLDNEDADGYYRDKCVFSEEIDIEDSVSLIVRYSGGAVMSYSLTAHSPMEGFRLVINGKNGRIEAESFHHAASGHTERIVVYNRQREAVAYTLPKVPGTHGGGDAVLREALFRGVKDDPLGQQAGSWSGAMSNAIGFAANRSMREGRSVSIGELIRMPDESPSEIG